MKYLLWGLGIAIAMGLVIFGVSYPLLQSKEMAEGLASIPIVGSSHIAEMLERRGARESFAADQQTAVKTFRGFEMPWYLLAAYGTLTLVAVVQLAGGIVGLIMGIVAGESTDPQHMMLGVAVLSIPTQLVGGYFIGRWIGTRSVPQRGVPTVLLCAALAALVTRAVDAAALTADQAQALYHGMSSGTFIYLSFISFAIFAVSSLLGYWRGTTHRLTKYMQYLLGVLPPGTRSTLVDLAYGEAEKVGTGQARAAASTP